MSGPTREFTNGGKGQFEQRGVCESIVCPAVPGKLWRRRWGGKWLSSAHTRAVLENKGGCAMEEGDQMSLLHGDAETKGGELRDRSGSGDRDRPRTGGDWGPDALSLL